MKNKELAKKLLKSWYRFQVFTEELEIIGIVINNSDFNYEPPLEVALSILGIPEEESNEIPDGYSREIWIDLAYDILSTDKFEDNIDFFIKIASKNDEATCLDILNGKITVPKV